MTLDPSTVHKKPSQKGTTLLRWWNLVKHCPVFDRFWNACIFVLPLEFFFKNQGAAFPVEQTWWSHFKLQIRLILRWLDSGQHIWKCMLYIWSPTLLSHMLKNLCQIFFTSVSSTSQFRNRHWSLDKWSKHFLLISRFSKVGMMDVSRLVSPP